jgi:hypothetical protein
LPLQLAHRQAASDDRAALSVPGGRLASASLASEAEGKPDEVGIRGRVHELPLVKSRAIFLDRDGVLSRPVIRAGKSYPPARVEDLEIYEGLSERLQRLKARGFVLIVVTNQPDVARGTMRRETVDDISSGAGRRRCPESARPEQSLLAALLIRVRIQFLSWRRL